MTISQNSSAQNLRRVQTFYDPYRQLHIKEDYTVLNTPPYQMHGLYRLWDQDKVLFQETNYVNGKKHGLDKHYFNYLTDHGGVKTGKLWQSISYRNGVLDGSSIQYDYLNGGIQVKVKEMAYANGDIVKEMAFFPNGTLSESIVLNGTCHTYFENSKLASRYTTKDGKLNGAYISYHPNGKVQMKSKYVGDLMVDTAITFYENGNVNSFQYRNPKTMVVESYTEKFPNGKPKFGRVKTGENLFLVTEYDSVDMYLSAKYTEEIDFGKDNQPYVKSGGYQSFHPNGRPKISSSYRQGFSDGVILLQDANGDTLVRGQFENGHCSGLWKIYYGQDWVTPSDMSTAKYYRLVNYDVNGKISGLVQDFYINGTKQFEGKLRGIEPDVFNGEVKFYHENGKIQLEAEIFRYDTTFIKRYSVEGILLSDITMNGNKRCVKYFREDGSPIESGCYMKTYINSPWKKYYEWEYFDEKGNRARLERYNQIGELYSTE